MPVAMICARRSSLGGSLQNITSGASVGCAYVTRSRACAFVTSSRPRTSTPSTAVPRWRSASAVVSHSGLMSAAVVGQSSASMDTLLHQVEVGGNVIREPAIHPGGARSHGPEEERDDDPV